MSSSRERRVDISTRTLVVAATTLLLIAVAAVVLVLATPSGKGPRLPEPPPLPSGPNTVPTSPTAGMPRQPNIVMIVTDDMRTDELAYMPRVRQLLVDQGTWFTHGISPHPMCCPARAELTTGEYAQNNGVHHNDGPYGGYQSLKKPDDNLGVWMQRAGYWTGFVGKWLNSYHGQQRIRGWNLWQAAISHVYDYHAVRYYGGPLIRGYVAHTTTRYAINAISQGEGSGKPFYVVANYLAPHDTVSMQSVASLPVPPARYAHACDDLQPDFLRDPAFRTSVVGGLPPAYLTRPGTPADRYLTEWRARICALRAVDDGVGRIVAHLRATGHLADTEIAFVSDNGFNLGEHWLFGKNFITDQSLDVPIVVRGPGFPAGLRSPIPVSLVDLPATYLQIGHASPGRTQDGESLLDLLAARKPLRDTLLVQTGDAVTDSSPGFAMRGVTTRRYLYGIDPSNPTSGVLVDRRSDPHALRNLFDDPRYADVRAALQRRLEALMPCSGADCNRVFGPLPTPRP